MAKSKYGDLEIYRFGKINCLKFEKNSKKVHFKKQLQVARFKEKEACDC